MKAYEATLTIDGMLVATATATSVFTAIDNVMNNHKVWEAKEIQITVKEI